MSPVPNRSTFETAYAGQAPWDIGRPQRTFLNVADKISGSILDAGCGTGENAIYFAGQGHKVTAVDFLEEAISRAKQKAAERGVTVTFLVQDALQIEHFTERFDTIIDSGLFHVFSDKDRTDYVKALTMVVKPGGMLYLLCFSDEEPGTHGPRRITRKELVDTFADSWTIESIQPSRFEVRPDLKDLSFSPGGPKAWFAVLRRAG